MPIKPMLCKLGTESELKVNDPDWIWEPKYDGARITAETNGAQVKLFGRSGREKTRLFTELKIQTVKDTPVILDGEITSGTSFNDLQHRINRTNGIAQATIDYPAKFNVFDIIEVGGADIRHLPLLRRKDILKTVLIETDNVKIGSHVTDGVALFDLIKTNGLEGVVGKNLNGRYCDNKREWLKVKCWKMGTFMAVGYTAGTGWRESSFGALILADTNRMYVGQVGTGFTDEMIRNLMYIFSPAPCVFPKEPIKATWIKPFPVKIKYLEYTNDGMLRFPSFKGVV